MTSRPLAGIRVADLSWVLAGPVVGRLLADAGAEVIKIESRKRMDKTRMARSIPARADAPDVEPFDRVPMFHSLNAGKQGVAIDMSTPAGIALARRIILRSDVVLDNFAPGVMQRLGLGYESLRAEHPGLIMASLSGTGQQGPLRDVPAYAPTVTSLAGLESIVGYPDRPDEPPRGLLGLNLADAYAALSAFYAVLAALWAKRRSGVGQFIDFSEMEAVCTMMAKPFIDYTTNARVMAPDGSRSDRAAPYGVFPTAGDDQWMAFAILDDREWSAFCAVTAEESWAKDARYGDGAFRIAHKHSLEAAIAEYTRSHDGPALIARWREAGLAVAPVHGFAGQLADPHFRERDLFRGVDVPGLGPQTIYGSPWRLTGTPTQSLRGAPRLGEHTREVLSRLLGLSETEIDRLAKDGVLN